MPDRVGQRRGRRPAPAQDGGGTAERTAPEAAAQPATAGNGASDANATPVAERVARAHGLDVAQSKARAPVDA